MLKHKTNQLHSLFEIKQQLHAIRGKEMQKITIFTKESASVDKSTDRARQSKIPTIYCVTM